MEKGCCSLGPSSAPGQQQEEAVLMVLSTQTQGSGPPACVLHTKGTSGRQSFLVNQLPTPNDPWLSLHRCWDINANLSVWWVIRGPVILSILVSGHPPLS